MRILKAAAVLLLALCPQAVTATYAMQSQVITGRYRKIMTSGGPATPTVVTVHVDSQQGGIIPPLTVTVTPGGSGHAFYILAAVGNGTIGTLTDSASTPAVVTSATPWNISNGGGEFGSWLVSSATTGSHTFNLTPGSSSLYGTMYVIELSNSSAAGSSSVTGVGSSNANPIPCSSITTSSGSIILLFAFVYNGGVTLSAGSGPPSLTEPTPSGTGLGFADVEYSGATTATTYTISSGFIPSSTGSEYFCYPLEAKP